jgi:hypothetical protein
VWDDQTKKHEILSRYGENVEVERCMKPFSNKGNIPLLIIAVGLLGCFLLGLAKILSGNEVISGPVS